MSDDIIIEKAIQEIETKTWGITEQFLEVHEILYAGGKPVIAGFDKSRADGVVIVYFAVKDEPFTYAIYFDTLPQIAFRWMGTVAECKVYFSATSEELSFEELLAITTLRPATGWNKGDIRKPGKTHHTFSRLSLAPGQGPGMFEDKLNKLLDLLEQDKEGVLALVEKANGYIEVAIQFHNGNGMLGGPHIDRACMRRMAELNLSVDFDLYATGNTFKD